MEDLKKQVEEQLDKLELKYNVNEEKKRFELDITMHNVTVSINLIYDEIDMRLFNISCLTFNLPKERTSAILNKINKIHSTSFYQAYLYLSPEDCCLAAQSMIDVPESGIDESVFAKFLFSTCIILDEKYFDIMKVAFGPTNDETDDFISKKTDTNKEKQILN